MALSSSSSQQGGAVLGMVWEGSERRSNGMGEGEEVLDNKGWGDLWRHPLPET